MTSPLLCVSPGSTLRPVDGARQGRRTSAGMTRRGRDEHDRAAGTPRDLERGPPPAVLPGGIRGSWQEEERGVPRGLQYLPGGVLASVLDDLQVEPTVCGV